MESASTRAQRTPLVPAGAIDHHVRDMTVTAAGDVTLAALQEHLAKHDQWLPIDGDPGLPLSRLIDTNSTGPLRLGYGAWRDVLLGVQFHNGRGELISAGGRTMKNVAGYDLTKFMVGQRGVFGNIVTLTTRTYRRPAGAILATFGRKMSIDVMIEHLNALLITSCRPQWAMLKHDALLCGYLGDEPTLQFIATKIVEYQPIDVNRWALHQDVDFRATRLAMAWTSSSETIRYRAAVPPSRTAAFVANKTPESWIADPAFGIVWGSASAFADVANDARQVGGRAIALTRDGRWLSSENADENRILTRLKQAFDPDQKLAPLPTS